MINVAVLRGGPSSEHEISLLTGKNVLSSLDESRYRGHDIYIDKKGVWHRFGIPKKPLQALTGVDVVFNALHGQYGESGEVQQFLQSINIPYTGSGIFGSSLAINKDATKKILQRNGIKTPIWRIINVNDVASGISHELFRSFPHPAIIKPLDSGSSYGVSVVNKFDDYKNAFAKAFEHSNKAIIEEFIKGKEGTVGVIDNFRGKDHYVPLPVEIVTRDSNFFDYDNKYAGKAHEILPGRFSKDETDQIMKLAVSVHKALHMDHYSRTDFIIHPKRGIYILEVNSLPCLAKESLLPKSLEAVGIKISDFLHHIVDLALRRKK